MAENVFDIFISYRNDGIGNMVASKLKEDLEKEGYSCYFNSDEMGSDEFPTRLADAVNGCKDLILIITDGCLKKLMAHEKVDYIRDELLTARSAGKHIIPMLMCNVSLPSDPDEMPEDLRFLARIDHIYFPRILELYKEATFGTLMERLISQPGKVEDYKNAFNENEFYDVVADFQRIKNEAQQGSAEAMYELANMYFYGMADDNGGSARNYGRAYEWFIKLAECSVAEYRAYAKNMIGHMLYSGTAPMQEQSYEKALALHMEAADTISSLGGAHVGYMLSVGSGCEFSLPEIEKYYMKLAEKDTLAELNLARLYKDHGMFDKAGAVYRQMWGRSAQAAYELGLLYKRGVLIEPHKPDYFQASFYFMQAMQAKDCVVDAYYQLATLYFNPTGGFPKNFEKAEELFKIAADKGHCGAQYNLAYMYENGHIQQDLEKAMFYHELAARQGEVMSMAALANLYQQPKCRDYRKAFQYAQMAAKQGSAMGAFIYANLCFIGRGTSPNINEAYRYYKFAHEHGFFQAGFMLNKLEQISNIERNF